MASKAILSIDWDARTLRIVHAYIGRTTKIDQVLSVPLPGDLQHDDAQAMGSIIKQALQKCGIRTKRALVDIPREKANFYTLKLPNAPVGELAGMVAFQIPKELPFPVEQAAVDFAKPPHAGEGLCDVLVGAVRLDVLEHLKSVFKHAGLTLLRVGLRPNANQFSVNELLKTTPYDRVLFVDVGPKTTEIDVLLHGHLVFSRAADVTIPESLEEPPTGFDAPSEDEEKPTLRYSSHDPSRTTLDSIVRELMIEVTRSIEAYRAADPGFAMDHAVIGGSCNIEEALSDAIQKRFNISAQPYNPATCFGWDADRGAAAGAFAATLGLTLTQSAESERRFDFLHPKKVESRAQLRLKKAPIAMGFAAVVALLLVGGYLNFIRPKHLERSKLEETKRELKGILNEQEDFKRLVDVLRGYENEQIVWLDEARDVLALLPDSQRIVLDGMTMSNRNRTIRFGFDAADSKVNHDIVREINGFRVSGEESQRFRAVAGGTTAGARNPKYPHEGSMTVIINDRSRSFEIESPDESTPSTEKDESSALASPSQSEDEAANESTTERTRRGRAADNLKDARS